MAIQKKRSASNARDAHGGSVPLTTTRDFAGEEKDPDHVAQRRDKLKPGSMGKASNKAKR